MPVHEAQAALVVFKGTIVPIAHVHANDGALEAKRRLGRGKFQPKLEVLLQQKVSHVRIPPEGTAVRELVRDHVARMRLEVALVQLHVLRAIKVRVKVARQPWRVST
jgi:hypothetical protein